MSLDLETIGYFLYMEEQEKNRSGEDETDQEQEETEGLYNG